jgi:beta-glucuronidase
VRPWRSARSTPSDRRASRPIGRDPRLFTRPGRPAVRRARRRPVTYASINAHDDKCFDLVDVVSANTYPGWYFGAVPDIPAELDRISAHVDALGHADKPLIISEIGAGAVPGWNDAHGSLWTEAYQTELLSTVVDHLLDGQDRISGLGIWVLGDFKTTELRRMALTRPRGVNDKGLIDEYRRPKQAFGAVRERFKRDRD